MRGITLAPGGPAMRSRAVGSTILVLVAFFTPAAGAPENTATVAGLVRAPSGAAIAGAQVSVLDAQRLPVRSAVTGGDGRFTIADLPAGRYILSVVTPGFERNERVIVAGEDAATDLVVDLPAAGVTEKVVVTATPGVPQEAGATSQAVNVLGEEELSLRAKTVLAQAAAEEP